MAALGGWSAGAFGSTSPGSVARPLVSWLAWAGALGAYALIYHALHDLSQHLNAPLAFHFWYLPAGLRFAVLWRWGGRATAPLILAEFLLRVVSLDIALTLASLANTLARTATSVLGYALAVHLARRRLDPAADPADFGALPTGVAMILAPAAAALLGFPLAWTASEGLAAGHDGPAIAHVLAIATLGDILGVLLLAPLFLTLLFWGQGRRAGPAVTTPRALEAILALALGAAVAVIFWRSGMGARLEPLLLCLAWIGLRSGRLAAWAANLAVAAGVLLAANLGGVVFPDRIGLHMVIACMAIAGYLAGSHADAERKLRADLADRDRLLRQAERLRTLRSMSVAVIHELSQPLSTLMIEAQHLAGLGGAKTLDRAEIAQSSTLIEAKARGLVELVRRLRRFGGRALDAQTRVLAGDLMAEVAALCAPEARAARVALRVAPAEALGVMGQDIELQQAVLNIVRNAIAAAPGGVVDLRARRAADGWVAIEVDDDARPGPIAPRSGMGVGLIIARTIAAAYGGRIESQRREAGGMRFSILLPEASGA